MSADKSFAAFGRHLCRPSLVVRRARTTLFPQQQHNTLARFSLAHSFHSPFRRPTTDIAEIRFFKAPPPPSSSSRSSSIQLYGLLPPPLPPPPSSRFPPKFDRRDDVLSSLDPTLAATEGRKEDHRELRVSGDAAAASPDTASEVALSLSLSSRGGIALRRRVPKHVEKEVTRSVFMMCQ